MQLCLFPCDHLNHRQIPRQATLYFVQFLATYKGVLDVRLFLDLLDSPLKASEAPSSFLIAPLSRICCCSDVFSPLSVVISVACRIQTEHIACCCNRAFSALS